MQGEAAGIRGGHQRLQSTLTRHRAFWERAGEGGFLRSVGAFAPSAPVLLRQPDGCVISDCPRLKPEMIDVGALVREAEGWDPARLDGSLVAQGQFLIHPGLGDLLPFSVAHPKIPWIEAMLGCPIRMAEGQIWLERCPDDPEVVIRRGASFEGNPWFQLYQEFVRELQRHLGEHSPASANTLLRGTCDLAAAVMGVEEACIAWLDRPGLMARLMRVCTDANLAVIEAGGKLVGAFEGGYVSGYGIWAPGAVVSTQADHSTLLSPRTYERQVLPYDLEVIRSCPHSIFHLHNCGLHVAPLLMEVPELSALEVVVDPYPTPERKPYEIGMLQAIQQRKPLILDASFPSLEEAEDVLGRLSPAGLCFNARFEPSIFASLPPGQPGSDPWLLD